MNHQGPRASPPGASSSRSQPNAPAPPARLVCAALLAVTVLLASCDPPAPTAPPGLAQATTLAPITAELPRERAVPGYSGSDSCRDCHRDQHASWHASFHRTMTQPATRQTVAAAFDGTILETASERFTLSRSGDEHWVAIEDLEELRALPAGQPAPPPVRVRIDLVTGSHHMQAFWLPAGYGNAQIGFPFTWLVEDQRWAPRHFVFIRNPQAPQPVETWNITCIRCHTTAAQPRPRPQVESYETRLGEFGIACEACHGPGDTHVSRMQAFAEARRSDPAAPLPSDLAICQPANLDPVRSTHVCAQCHSMKWFDHQENWTENGFRYRPGDDLEATTPVIRPAHIHRQPWIQGILQKHPGLLDEFFWSDGMIRVAGREFNGLLESACFEQGGMSCLSCHSMHDYADPADQLTPARDSDTTCLACHSPEQYQRPDHTHHPPGSSGASCHNCHMPHTTYALLKGVRQHQIDSPAVAASLRTGRPNACNLCHLDRTLAWTARHLNQWYGGDRHPIPDDAGDDVAAAVQWLIAGDAGQRAILAWHFGWDPARQTSGTEWATPLVAHLLADPYPAVRHIAHRALRQLPTLSDLPYDFAASPERQATVIAEAFRRTRSVKPPPRDARAFKALLRRPDGTMDEDRFQALARQRDDRPVHLRE